MEHVNGKSVSLSSLKSIDIVEREIFMPGSTDGTGWIITLAGPGHPKTIELADRNSKKTLKRQQMIEAATVNGRKWKPPETDVEEQKLDNVTSIVARIVTWRGLRESEDGPDVPFSEEKAIELFMDPALGWVFWQIVEWLADERSFIKRSETT